ncbi:NADH-quinone oxidoreductase subunit N [Candidatus Sumerlaeota bacterium]|nr:NADH-quinone oxidoreductase subunit N [Candidatus Sumerlaeota bacterium]
MGYDLRPDLTWPEIAMLMLVVAVMFADMILRPERRGLLFGLSAAGLVAIGLGMVLSPHGVGTAFHGAHMADGFSWLVKIFMTCVLLTVILVTWPFLDRLRSVVGTHLILVLASGLGMMALASSNSLIVMFIALELATIPLMILTALGRGDSQAHEAGLKFLIFGAVASAFTIFGIALVWGYSGGLMNLTDLRGVVAAGGAGLPMTIGVVMLFAGLAFKTAIAPFHVWVPDVYQGAPTPITAFLAGGSKAAGFTALLRVAVALFAPGEGEAIIDWPLALAILAGLTAVLGNMAAIWQTDLKRLLAHASVGHAGFLLMGMAVIGTAGGLLGLSALAYYLVFYAAAVALVFFCMGLVSRAGGGDLLSDFEGLGRRSPAIAAAMLVGVLSMGGIPPLAGFTGKILILAATVKGELIWLTFIAGFAMVLSIVYMLMILRALYLLPPREGAVTGARLGRWEGAALIILSLLLIVFGAVPGPVLDPIREAMQAMAGLSPTEIMVAATGG